MSLVTVTHCRAHLRLPSANEDSLLTIYLAEALARIIAYIGRPVTAVERTFTDVAKAVLVYGVVQRLSLPQWPIDPETVEVVDADGEAVPAEDFVVHGESGFLEAKPGAAFANGPYEITCDVGLSASGRYALEYEPIVNGALLDLVADKYQRRISPGVSAEAVAGGLSRSFSPDAIPANIRSRLDALRLVHTG